MKKSRRHFLKQSVAAITAAGASPAAGLELVGQPQRPKQALSGAVMQAIAEVVLPVTELGDDGIRKVVSGFQSWLDGFEPVAELDHPYLSSSEIQYGPPDPRPRWQAQLEGFDLEAEKKYGSAFAQLRTQDRRLMIERAIRDERSDRLPSVAEAHHVAVALLAYFYSTPAATDMCYDAMIERWGCHGLETGTQKPASRGRG